ncbi:hypothetical protein DB771_01720 [Burkholderia sp. AU29985]|nr:hypothetical protein EGY28_03820 [Burkholderia dolosa]PRE39754.1 hypothetical protein C6P87_29755 [Burkholderia sp. AU12872]PUA78611.1 hypothetical protein DB771_01720 [Burkholderia sp. AU29985]
MTGHHEYSFHCRAAFAYAGRRSVPAAHAAGETAPPSRYTRETAGESTDVRAATTVAAPSRDDDSRQEQLR